MDIRGVRRTVRRSARKGICLTKIFLGFCLWCIKYLTGYIFVKNALCNWSSILSLFLRRITIVRTGYHQRQIERGDAYIDKLLQEMFENRVEEYDPYKIEDSIVGFSKKIAFVNVTGEAKLHDGYITGLKTLHRSDACNLKEENGRLNVIADLGAGVLDFHYSGSVKFMSYGPTITVQGNLGYVEVHMAFSFDSRTGNDGKLEKFIIDDMRGMKVWITGLGPLNWAVNPIIAGVTTIFKRFVRNFLESKVEAHIAERLPKFKFPIEGDDDVTEVTTMSPEGTSSDEVVTEVTTEASEATETVSEQPETEASEATETVSEQPETEAESGGESDGSTETLSTSEDRLTEEEVTATDPNE